MSYAFPVPAQALAQDYLVQVAQRHPGRLRVGGHSKGGGNLAVWAALHAPPLLRRRILRVTSHDGPGFGQDLTRTRAYGALAPRLVTYIPQASWWGPFSTRTPGPRSSRATGWGRWASTTPSPGRCGGPALSHSPAAPGGRPGERRVPGLGGRPVPGGAGRSSPRSFSTCWPPPGRRPSPSSPRAGRTAPLAVAGAYAALPPAVRRDMLDYLWRFLVNMGTGGRG